MLHFILFAILISTSLSLTPDEFNIEQRLKKNLTENYDPVIRPVRNSSSIIYVNILLKFNQILKVNLLQQTIKSTVWFYYIWTDEFMTWNMTEHPLDSIFTKADQIWRPDFLISNMLSEDKLFDFLLAEVDANGTVYLVPPMNVETSCMMHVEKFPFDEQKCNITIANWSYSTKQIRINLNENPVDLRDYTPNPEWDLLSIKGYKESQAEPCCPDVLYEHVNFVIHLKRRPSHFLWNLVAPCIALLFISLFGNLLPPTSGERISLSITCLLAFTVFLLMVPDTLPPDRLTIPQISKFFGVSVFLLGFNTISTVLVLSLYHGSDLALPPRPWQRHLLLNGIAKLSACLERDLIVELNKRRAACKAIAENENTTIVMDISKEDLGDVMADAKKETDEDRELSPAQKEVWRLEWILMSKGFDWLSMWVMIIGCLLNILIFFLSDKSSK